MALPEKYLRPDNRGRVALGALAKGIERYRVVVEKDGVISLHPEIAVPANELWLYKNPKALAKVIKGIEDVKEGRITPKGDFTKYLNEE